jgi:hypothetical protein
MRLRSLLVLAMPLLYNRAGPVSFGGCIKEAGVPGLSQLPVTDITSFPAYGSTSSFLVYLDQEGGPP